MPRRVIITSWTPPYGYYCNIFISSPRLRPGRLQVQPNPETLITAPVVFKRFSLGVAAVHSPYMSAAERVSNDVDFQVRPTARWLCREPLPYAIRLEGERYYLHVRRFTLVKVINELMSGFRSQLTVFVCIEKPYGSTYCFPSIPSAIL